MSDKALADAVQAAIDRMDALTGAEGEATFVSPSALSLAFVGFDVNGRELLDFANDIAKDYGVPVMATLAMAADAEGDGESWESGMAVGKALRDSLAGAFVLGALVGALHRDRRD